MDTPLRRATELTNLLSKKLYNLSITDNLRNRLAGACFAITQEHQHAIVILLNQDRPFHSSAFALIRPVFESYIRGLWLSHCATDSQLEAFSQDKKLPDTASLVTAVEKAGDFDGKQLSTIYAKHWSSFCSYTHTGSLQVQRWNTAKAIEPGYTDEEVREVIEFSGAIAMLSAVSTAALANNDSLARELLADAKVYANPN